MRSILIAIVIIAWILLGWLYCRDYNRCCTDPEGDTTSVPIIESPQVASDMAPTVMDDDDNDMSGAPVDRRGTTNNGPLLFKWDSEKPILGDDWSDKRQAILDGLNDNQQLEITGLYRSGEDNNSAFDNLGLARANELKKLFAPPLDASRIVVKGKLADAGDDDRFKSFESISFRNLTNTAKIKETADRTLIYFPYNSTKRLDDPEIERYLNDVADRVKKSGESIRLTGHTDSFGSASSNLRLGRYRADIIKTYLISKGIPEAKIISQSKGETEPIATNKTKDGRAKNRRTELQIIK